MDFNDVIFAVSADCYSDLLFPRIDCESRGRLKSVAREAVGFILEGASDYYMEANFSPDKLKANEEFFWRGLSTEKIDEGVALRLHIFEALVESREEGRDSAIALIGSVSARLRFLHTDGFSIEVGDALIEAVAAIQGEEFDLNEVGQVGWREINRVWDDADSEWDKHLAGVMCDVPDSVCVTVNHLLNSENSLNYLLRWRRGISREHFAVLVDAIERQALSELPTNQKVAKWVMEILAPLRK
ncbi:hypothetical protein [Burkholderia stagnalis]